MDLQNKKTIYNDAQKHVTDTILKIKKTYDQTLLTIKNIKARIKKAGDVDRIIETQVLENSMQRVGELEQLKASPYFVACDVSLYDKEREVIFFSKFNYSEDNIYSWTAPASTIRYESPGDVSYKLANGQRRPAKLFRKDQFMIVDGRIIFMASEKLGSPRQLVHQEHLMPKKGAFVLPEIVEQMEKKQDEVIRADYRGSYLISGPAGSGKTTLALHRAAYLALSPDTAEYFMSRSFIVFVHDVSTKDYFSELLPQLGINNAKICIFSDWVKSILDLNGYEIVYRYGQSEKEKDFFEYYKNKALRSLNVHIEKPEQLIKVYEKYFDKEMSDLFKIQLEQKLLDRFDLTILLQSLSKREAGLKTLTTVIKKNKRGKNEIKREMTPLKYSLIIIDEAENYLKEQIEIIKDCADNKKAVLYVGDLAQQTKLCTIKDWREVGEAFDGDRKVELLRVYRNTKEILEYVRSRGYQVNVPKEIKSGSKVIETTFKNQANEEKFINDIISRNKKLIIGIIHHDVKYLERYKKQFLGNDKIYALSIDEAQGVEFDVVIFLDYKREPDLGSYSEELKAQKLRVQRDLNYVAMTRAMNELWVCFMGE